MSKVKVLYQENGKLLTKTILENDISTLPNTIIEIKPVKEFKDYFNLFPPPYKNIVALFQELSIILNTGITLFEALNILIDGNDDIKINQILNDMKQAIKNGQPVYKALINHKKVVGNLPILFFKLSYTNGNIAKTTEVLSITLNEGQKAKKQFVEALTYPAVLIGTLLISIVLIFNFVLPRFEHIFTQFGSKLPLATKYLLATKDFMENNYIFLVVFIGVGIISIKYIYTRYKYHIDKIILLYIPLFSHLYLGLLLYRFFTILAMLLKAKYQFQMALESSIAILENEYLVSQIKQILIDIKNGKTISDAFINTKLFNTITIRLLHTAQETNTLDTILVKITDIYKNELDKNIKNFSTAVTPIFIMFISSFILWLVFALMLPIWELGNILN